MFKYLIAIASTLLVACNAENDPAVLGEMVTLFEEVQEAEINMAEKKNEKKQDKSKKHKKESKKSDKNALIEIESEEFKGMVKNNMTIIKKKYAQLVPSYV